MRGSVQNGFRAPSLQQQFFQTTSTNNVPGIGLVEVTTFPASDPVARALGAKDLDAEKSKNFSVGAVLRLRRARRHDRRLSHRHRRPHRAVGEPHFRGSRAVPQRPGLRRPRRRPLLHQRRRHAHRRRRRRVELSAAKRRWPGASTSRWPRTSIPPTSTRCRRCGLAGVNPPPVLFDHLNVLTFEEGTPQDKYTATRQLVAVSLRSDAAGDALRRRSGARHDGSDRSHAVGEDAGRLRSAVRHHGPRPGRVRRRQSHGRVPGPESGAEPQSDRHAVVQQLLAVRPVGPLRLRQAQLPVLSSRRRNDVIGGPFAIQGGKQAIGRRVSAGRFSHDWAGNRKRAARACGVRRPVRLQFRGGNAAAPTGLAPECGGRGDQAQRTRVRGARRRGRQQTREHAHTGKHCHARRRGIFSSCAARERERATTTPA